MILGVAILSKNGDIFHSNLLPTELSTEISKHAKNFLYSMSIQDDDIELPYIETTNLRYIYKETDDLYWLLVTKLESEMFVDINLLGKFVCTIMEYGSSETNSQSLTDEQRELFYRHIWRPWDEGAQCSFCYSNCNSAGTWEREFETRLQFLTSIRDGHVCEDDVNYFNNLISEAWAISIKLSPKWNTFEKEDLSDTDSVCSFESKAQSISEEAVIDGCRLKCRLEDIRIELTRLQDQYLRLFARRDLLVGTRRNHAGYQLSSAPLLKELDSDGQVEVDF